MKAVVSAVLAILAAAALALFPLAGTAILQSSETARFWLTDSVRRLYPVILASSLLFSFALWHLARRPPTSRLAALRHLAWLPSLFIASYASAWMGSTVAGMLVPLGGTFLAALTLEELLRPALDRADATPPPHPSRATWRFFVATALLLLALWFGFAKGVKFDGGGDVKHYQIQTANLVERGDLDLTDKMNALMAADNVPDDQDVRADYIHKSHMKLNAEGRIYSAHSFGFPLLVWPFRLLFGQWFDPFLFALVGAMALAGVRAACLAHGAPRASANLVTVLTGLSYVWAFGALAFLPEMLGFGLCAWAFWAIAAQHTPRQRIAATLASVIACVYLPVAHIRFAPLALALAVFFEIEGLLVRDGKPWRSKIPRLAIYGLLCLAGWVALIVAHRRIFAGTAAYPYADIAGQNFFAAWAFLADRRGITSVVPAIGAYAAATLLAALRGGAVARRAAMALAAAAAVVYCCCCTPSALDGACLNGRYFYNALPLLLPFFAIALPKADRRGRIWILFLLLLPVLYFLFITFHLHGAALLRAPASMRHLLAFQTFWEPYPSFYGGSDRAVKAAGSFFAAAVMAVSFLACLRRRPAVRLAAAAILLCLAFLAGRFVTSHHPPRRSEDKQILDGYRHYRCHSPL